jgi:hypothetical protein
VSVVLFAVGCCLFILSVCAFAGASAGKEEDSRVYLNCLLVGIVGVGLIATAAFFK